MDGCGDIAAVHLHYYLASSDRNQISKEMRFHLPTGLFSRFFCAVRARLRFLWAPPEPVTIRIIERDPFRVTVEEWRTNEELCRQAYTALKDPTVRRMLDTLRNTHLGLWDMPSDLTTEQRAIRAATIEGYGTALNTFERLAEHKKPQEQIEATFDPSNIE